MSVETRYPLGARSLANLSTAHPVWTDIIQELSNYMNVTVLQGFRGKEEQNQAVKEGRSKTPWPESAHNTTPSIAIDVVPYPVDWNDVKRMSYMAGMIRMIGLKHGYEVRWGGDWDSDGEVKDQTFHDLPHVELRNGPGLPKKG